MTVATDILAEGKTKIIRATDKPDEVAVQFKDSATAFNGIKAAEFAGKGALNAQISTLLFQQLEDNGIPTCFIQTGDSSDTLVYRSLSMIPLEVVVRNVALGSIVNRYSLEPGRRFEPAIIEFFQKSQDDPLITDDVILALGMVKSQQTLQTIRSLSMKINDVFRQIFSPRNIECADFKLEFGLDAQNRVILGDELSPDNFRLRDITTGQVLDKDVFRQDLGDLLEAYQQVLTRLETPSLSTKEQTLQTYEAEVFVQSRQNILNPESKAILEGVHTLGYKQVTQMRAGRRFELTIQAASFSDAETQALALAQNVLSNPVIEDCSVQIRASRTVAEAQA